MRRGKGGRRREVGMDDWCWQELQPWLEHRLELPIGPLFCIINGTTSGRHWATAAARASSDAQRQQLECAAASHHTSSAMPTPWRWRAKAYR